MNSYFHDYHTLGGQKKTCKLWHVYMVCRSWFDLKNTITHRQTFLQRHQ